MALTRYPATLEAGSGASTLSLNERQTNFMRNGTSQTTTKEYLDWTWQLKIPRRIKGLAAITNGVNEAWYTMMRTAVTA